MRKFVIVCYEKVVRIPLECDEILQVHGERTLGATKALMNDKRQVEFRIDLVPRAMPVAKSPYHLAPSEMQEFVGVTEEGGGLGDALSRNERVKSRRVRGMILAAQSEAFKQENVLAERLHGLEQQMERKGDESLLLYGSNLGSIGRKCYMVEAMTIKAAMSKTFGLLQQLEIHATESVRDAIGFEYCLASSSGWTKVKVKSVLRNYSGVHDYIYGVKPTKCLANASLHMPLDEIKVDKTLRFVEEPVEIMDREIKSLKRSKISLVKVCLNSKRGPEFTWEREDYIKSKYP
ncbi:hypothetical protein Tco_1457949 [Tanacetum coccineum]